ncbi:MAG: hypothetical protein Q8R57_11600 [Bacteroidota bacterium]|nr:hypothetical protein [Bacteroidota bacterium]
MAYYFFTEIDKLNDQNAAGNGEAYGPTAATGGKDRFRITSTHKVSANAKVIAVCKGTILVQEQYGNSDFLNIILKPFEQPPFEFPKIKYFIYRGVKKSSLVAGTNIVAKATNPLTDSLWTDYNAFNNLTNQAPPIELLGLGMNSAIEPYRNNDAIEMVFAITFEDHQLPVVQAGWHIANFDNTINIGFEIMFESLGFEPTLEIARKPDHIIEVTTLPSTPTQAVFFEHWHDKEDILNYLDPSAFWGSFYSKNLIVFNNGDKNKKKADELYTDVLSLYLNTNKCYIDIRNEFNFSLNYFKNYGTNATNNTTEIKLGKGSGMITDINYYSNGWPILILDNTGFSSTTNKYQELRLQLPCGNGDNPAPLIYISKAYKSGIKFPETFKLNQKFLTLTVYDNYTQVFNIAAPWVNGNLFSSFIRIKHCKRNTSEPLPTLIPTQIRRKDALDVIFTTRMNFDNIVLNFKAKVFDEFIYTDLREDFVFEGVFNLIMAIDSNNVTLLANPIEINSVGAYNRTTFSIAGSPKIGNDEINYLDEIMGDENGNILKKKALNITNGDINILEINRPYKVLKRYNEPDMKKIFGLTLTKTQWVTLLSIANDTVNFDKKYPIYISLINKQILEDIDLIKYITSEIALLGYKKISNNITTILVDSNIIINTYA